MSVSVLLFSALLLCSNLSANNSAKKASTITKQPAKVNIMALADKVQRQYNKTTSATFSFEQSYQHPFLPVKEISKGQGFFKAKNMLWRYTEPADRRKEFFIEGKKFTYHLINDKVAYTHNCFEKDTLSASITFLWGQGNLKTSFDIKELANIPNPHLKWLSLIPKEKNAPVKSVSLGIDEKTSLVKESIVTDLSDGINSFKFSDFKTNLAIAPETFHFIAPEGVKVQAMPNISCPEPAVSSAKPAVLKKLPLKKP